MTTLAAFILGALLAATLTLPAFVRLIRQRDAAATKLVRAMFRNDVLMQQLDAQIEDTAQQRARANGMWRRLAERDQRIVQLEAEALPKAPNWGAAPAEWRHVEATPDIFLRHTIPAGAKGWMS